MPPRPTAPDLNRPSSDLLRRPSEYGGSPAPSPATAASREAEVRQLIVGREIGLSGEIKACDRLIVEGSVEANLANCQDVNIAESGLFRGSASIDDAEIRGRFEGTLTVRNRLFIRASGKVTGTVRYGQIEIECGGQISGDVQAQPTDHIETPEPRRERAPQAVVDLGPSRVA
jgi:cytoskeletal protein CcmA (bactofilin family)